MKRYTEEDITDYFNTPVEQKYDMSTAPRETQAPIPTRDIEDLEINPMDQEVATQASNHLANLNQNMSLEPTDKKEYSNEEASPENSLINIPKNELTTEISPSKWFSVAELPGNASQQVKALGNSLFSEFTKTPIKEIAVMSTLSNSETEVKKIYAGIQQQGEKVKTVDLDFSQTMPNYTAQGEIWRAHDYEFLLVKDFAGYYVYGWPQQDSLLLSQANPIKGYLESCIGITENKTSIFAGWINE